MTATTLDFCFDRMGRLRLRADKSNPQVGRTLPDTECSVGGSGPSAYLHVTGLSFDWPDNRALLRWAQGKVPNSVIFAAIFQRLSIFSTTNDTSSHQPDQHQNQSRWPLPRRRPRPVTP